MYVYIYIYIYIHIQSRDSILLFNSHHISKLENKTIIIKFLPLIFKSGFPFCSDVHNYQTVSSTTDKIFKLSPNLHKLIKEKSPSIPRNLALGTFGELPNSVLNKVNLLYLLYSTAWKCRLPHLIKHNCLLETFLRTLILITQLSLCRFSFLELI